MKRPILFFSILLFPFSLIWSQTISGKIVDSQNQPLIGANVFWLNTTIGTQSDVDGNFNIQLTDSRQLVASQLGYTPDTIEYSNQASIVFQLKEAQTLEEVVVKDSKDGTSISTATVIKTENINEVELTKAACCDLAGCFETNLTVQPQTTNVITNSKELRILGLSGVYNQVLIDGFPMIQGLSYTYGISNVPGTIVQNIFVSKGANSVLQGYESISGQINVITKSPANTDKLFLNAYVNSFLEKQLNANYTFKKGMWSNLTAAHVVQPADKIDRDDDNFLDLPLLTRYVLMNKWQYRNESDWGWSSKIGVRFVNEERIGGQEDFDAKTDKGSTEIYGQTVNYNQPEFYTKTGFRLDEFNNFVFFGSGFYQNQNSYFGTVKYDAKQTNLYANLQYERKYATHSFKTGLSYRYLRLEEDVNFTDNSLSRTYDGDYLKKEQVPGVFAENTIQLLGGRFTWITGMRVDHLNNDGFYVTPRTLVKYDFGANSTIRASFGTGWRTVNLFSENINLLVSSRDIVFAENLNPEKAMNYGINYTHKIDGNNIRGYISTDFYRTDFQNQIFPDYDSDPTKAIIQNFTGTSVGNGFQTELSLKFFKQWEFKTGYNYLDVYRTTGEVKEQLPFNKKHKILGSFGFKPLSNKYQIDFNSHWHSKARLPSTASNPAEYQRPDFSRSYFIANAQFTYYFKNLQVYTGCENFLNFRQEEPIISWQNPFGKYFDTSSVWGSTRGREFYVGVRWKIEK